LTDKFCEEYGVGDDVNLEVIFVVVFVEIDDTDEAVDKFDMGLVVFTVREDDLVEEAVLGFNLVLLWIVEFTDDLVFESDVDDVAVVGLTFFDKVDDFWRYEDVGLVSEELVFDFMVVEVLVFKVDEDEELVFTVEFVFGFKVEDVFKVEGFPVVTVFGFWIEDVDDDVEVGFDFKVEVFDFMVDTDDVDEFFDFKVEVVGLNVEDEDVVDFTFEVVDKLEVVFNLEFNFEFWIDFVVFDAVLVFTFVTGVKFGIFKFDLFCMLLLWLVNEVVLGLPFVGLVVDNTVVFLTFEVTDLLIVELFPSLVLLTVVDFFKLFVLFNEEFEFLLLLFKFCNVSAFFVDILI